MENKEKKVRGRERAQRAVVGAGVTQGLIAVVNVIAGAREQDIFNFAVFGLASLAFAVFFVLFKHPVWGILNTVVYAAGRVLSVMGVLWAYVQYPSPVIVVSLIMGVAIAVALTAYFIYADYQAFQLRQFELDADESE